jgi:hypothetical protein
MANKRTRSGVPAAETGAIPGDYSGNRPFMNMPEKGGHNKTTNEAHRGAGQVAPRPRNSKSQLMGASAHTAPVQASMARVKAGGGAPAAGSFLPVQNSAMANLANRQVGQSLPGLGPVATTKPKRKGLGSAFYGE